MATEVSLCTYCTSPTYSLHPCTHIIDATLAKECTAGRMAGQYSSPPLAHLRCSGLGVVTQKDGGWLVICHLSAPRGCSVNDYINPEHYSLSYCTIDDAIINTLGPGTLMGKIDLKKRLSPLPSSARGLTSLGDALARSMVHRQMSSVLSSLLSLPL